MTVMLITAWRAAETLAAFHRQCAADTAGDARVYHEDMVRLCAAEAASINRAILASGVTEENQTSALRRRDLATAQKIIDRHPIMHGIVMAVEDVGKARVAMAGDIADALAAERGGLEGGASLGAWYRGVPERDNAALSGSISNDRRAADAVPTSPQRMRADCPSVDHPGPVHEAPSGLIERELAPDP